MFLSYHATAFAQCPSRWSRCAHIVSQVGSLRGNRSPSTFSNNLSKTSLLIIQSAWFPCVRQTAGKKTDGAKRSRGGWIGECSLGYNRSNTPGGWIMLWRYTIAYTQRLAVPAVSINKRRKDQLETIKLFILRRSCFVDYREHYCYLVKLLIRSLLTACIRMSLLPNTWFEIMVLLGWYHDNLITLIMYFLKVIMNFLQCLILLGAAPKALLKIKLLYSLNWKKYSVF